MSWDELKKAPEIQEIIQSDIDKQIQILIIDVFHCNEDGKKLLQLLLNKYLFAPVCPHNASAAYGYYREGQNSILMSIKLMIEEYNLNKNR